MFSEVIKSLLKTIGDNVPMLEGVMEEITETLPDIQVISVT